MGTRVGVPQPGDRVADRYELTRQIGSGAAGVVFEAAHLHIGRRVALKWLYPHLAVDPVGAKRFLNEARAACLIDHPNVIDVFDAGPDRDSLFLVMELLEGEPLSNRMQRGFSNPGDLVDLLLPALRGVDAAHRVGVIHRDLKPENIFLARSRPGRQGGPKVLDFGISKLHERREGLTHAGSFVGSPFYMAPEQVTDASTVDARVDIYAIGVLLYEGLSGQLPFESESLSDLFFKVTREKPDPLDRHRPDLPRGLVRAIHRAMASDPAERYSNVTSLAVALEAFANQARFLADEEAPTLAAPHPLAARHAAGPVSAHNSSAGNDRVPSTRWKTDPDFANDHDDATRKHRVSADEGIPDDDAFLDGAATIADGNSPFGSDAPTTSVPRAARSQGEPAAAEIPPTDPPRQQVPVATASNPPAPHPLGAAPVPSTDPPRQNGGARAAGSNRASPRSPPTRPAAGGPALRSDVRTSAAPPVVPAWVGFGFVALVALVVASIVGVMLALE